MFKTKKFFNVMAGSDTTWFLRYNPQSGNVITFYGEDSNGDGVMPSNISVEPASAVVINNNEVTLISDVNQIIVNAYNSDGTAENCPLTVQVSYNPPPDTTKKNVKLNNETIEAIYAGNEKVHAILLGEELVYGKDYIHFKDPLVRSICVQNFSSDGIGVTYEDAEAVTTFGSTFDGVTGITEFDELQYFKGLTMSDGLPSFTGCTNLKHFYLPEQNGYPTTYQLQCGLGYQCPVIEYVVINEPDPIPIEQCIGSTEPLNGDYPIYLPDAASVSAYSATSWWSGYTRRLHPISDFNN